MSDDVATREPNTQSKTDQVATAIENSARIDAADKPSAYIVIENSMKWWDSSANELYEYAIQFLKNYENLHRRSAAGELTAVIKALADHKKNAVDAAAKLIAFQAPKLNNIELNSEQVHKFVMLAPPVITDKDKWLAKVQTEQKLIDVPPINRKAF